MSGAGGCWRANRRRICFRCSRRRLSYWLIEPGIGLLLVWGLFSYFSTVPPAHDRRYDIQIKIDRQIAVRVKEDALANIIDREDLLFLQDRKLIPRENVVRMALDLPQMPAETKNEKLIKQKKPEFLVGEVRAEGEAIDESKKSENKEKAVVDIENSHNDDPVVYHQQNRPYCPGRRWSLTAKTAKLYDVVGYSRHQQQPVGCSSEACLLNEGRSPLKVDMSIYPCNVQECLTVTIKTRFRYENTMRFIDSIHDLYPRMKIIVIDEEHREKFANRSSIDEWENFLRMKGNELVSHVQAPPGVGFGRKLGAQLAKTKYILVVDDDYMFTKLSNVTRLVELLERSDASIVSGDTSDGFAYAGAFRVARNNTTSESVHLALYPNVFYELVDCYRNCFVADIVKTFFVADREAILKAGAWDSERKFYEHEDFFINMRRARIKVVNCKDIKVKHAPINQKLAQLRRESHSVWQKHLLQKWKIDDLYICLKYTYKETKTTCSNGRHFY